MNCIKDQIVLTYYLQSDQYHYLHHRFFECNYGTSGTPFDKMFGTFRDKLKVSKLFWSIEIKVYF